MALLSLLALAWPLVMLPQDANTNILMALRWVHFLAGILWIGLVYFFNLVNVPFMKQVDAGMKPKVFEHMTLRALWWFRWSSVVAVLAGITYWMMIGSTDARNGAASGLFLRLNAHGWESNRLLAIGIGGGMGLVMMLNVWGIIWRINKKVIQGALAGSPPANAAQLGRQAFLASRANAFLSLPLLFFMAAASHYPMFTNIP